MHNLHTNFCKILTLCKQSLKPFLLPNGNVEHYPNPPQMSDIEIIALTITAETLSIPSENHLIAKIKSDYADKFPCLPSRPRFNIRKRRLHTYIAEISNSIMLELSSTNEALIVDSVPLQVCENARAKRSKVCREDPLVQPAKGYCASQRRWYHGFKMQLYITESGLPLASALYPASCHDVNGLDLINDLQLTEREIIADRGYLSTERQFNLFETYKIRIVTPLRRNMDIGKSQWNTTYRYKRKRVETLLSQLLDQMNLRKNYAKTLEGLLTRVVSKLAAVSISQKMNFLNDRPLNHIKFATAT